MDDPGLLFPPLKSRPFARLRSAHEASEKWRSLPRAKRGWRGQAGRGRLIACYQNEACVLTLEPRQD